MKDCNLNLIKEYAYNIEKHHIKNFHSDFLKLILKDLRMDIYKFKGIVDAISEIEMRYKKSYNYILSNELLLIFIYEINLSGRKKIDSN